MATYFTFTNLYRAYQDCRKNKNSTYSHRKFAYDLERNLCKLETDLTNRTYRPGRSIAFVVTQPKIREIFAADFRDRVVHHLLYNYLMPVFEPYFIYDSWACRPTKGTHGAMLRLQYFTRLATRNHHPRTCYYLKMDIKSFFTSIDKSILYDLIKFRVKKEEICWLTHVNIFHDCVRDIPPRLQSSSTLFDSLPPDKSLFTVAPYRGLPIGNLTSQFFANVYLHELDNFIKHHLKAKYYVRYVDDFILIHDNKKILDYYQQKISAFVRQHLHLRIHPDKVFIRPISCGIDFVGYVVRPSYVLIRRRTIGEWRRRLELVTTITKRRQIYYAYQAHARWANSYKLQRAMRQKFSA